ncbi:16479_t:CDS:2, partial [Racocetra fulgida]
MPPVSYINRRNTISEALKELNNYPSNSKRPSINSVAKSFGIPEATLRRAVKNGNPPNRTGPPTILTKHEEDQLAGYCINVQKLGFGLTRSGVNHCVMEILRLSKRPHPFNNNGPGHDWWVRFMRDHPELSFRTPQELSEARAQKANATIEEHITLKNENDLLRSQVKKLSEELETYKNPGTCALCLALKYPVSQAQNSQ